MKSEAAICPALTALALTVFEGDQPIRAIVTRELLERVFGDIGNGQLRLLTAFEKHRTAIEALVLEKYHETGKAPVVLHAP